MADEPTLADLHQRDLRNTATPIHAPVVQHVDFAAAEDEDRLDETTATTSRSVEGDADHAVAAAESIREQIEDRDERLGRNLQPTDLDDSDSDTADDSDEPQRLNAYGNVAPSHSEEAQAERATATAPALAPPNGGDATQVPGHDAGLDDGDSELATAGDTEDESDDEADTHAEYVDDRAGSHPVPVEDEDQSDDEDQE